MSLTSPLATFANATLTVTRRATGTYVDGALVPGAATVYNSVSASVRPINGKDLKALPEGTRTEDGRAVMCTFALAVDDVITGYKSESWRVVGVRDWDVRGATYVRAVMVRTRIGA